MRIVYFDCFSGISGDMILGAFVALGVDLNVLNRELAKLKLTGYRLSTEPVTRGGIAGTRFNVEISSQDEQSHRSLSDILALIEHSDLSLGVKQLSTQVFRRLARAEAKIHATTMEQVHFHEAGAIDSIIDIVGAAICLELLNIDRVYCSKLNVGSGFVHCQHGVLPVPAPATLELLQGVPIYARGSSAELVTPTGAAFITTVARRYGSLPGMTPECIGYGAGWSDLQLPNLMRIILGSAADQGREVTHRHAQPDAD